MSLPLGIEKIREKYKEVFFVVWKELKGNCILFLPSCLYEFSLTSVDYFS